MTGSSTDGVDRLRSTLDAIGATGRTVELWWRDDDLERPSAELDALLDALTEHGIVPALAAVSGRMTADVLPALERTPARLFVHGWLHADHSAVGSKKSEFGPERPIEIRLAEIAGGRRRLAALAGDRLLPCFVPPWNRIGDDLLDRLGGTGVTALSGFAPWDRAPARSDVPRLDTHVDLIDWRAGQMPLTIDAVAETLGLRIAQCTGPIGILSHHLVTDARTWQAWEPLLAGLSRHAAVRWLDPAAALAAVATTPAVEAGSDIRRTA
ncbi:polysaccharide deacetylase family protein [Thalassobaculum sp.]|uniref:polysaccharide deacetylase family protein n=1 Tax=Thalassobaculum sp. TaxID=2022740 RepID=UPI0032EC55C4